jgi:phosphate transport system permease protein
MSTVTSEIVPPEGDGALDQPRELSPSRIPADRLYRRLAVGAGLTTLGILFLIGLFLLIKSWPAFKLMGLKFFTTSQWDPESSHRFGVAAVLYWTAVIAVIALVIAVPVSIATALFITEYAPPRLRRWLISLVDLLAAIPSIIYGIWGVAYLEAHLVGVSRFLSHNFGFLPFFKTSGPHSSNGIYAASAFMAGAVVALMVLPICTSVIREVFSQTPQGEKEAALALGGSRWGMIRTVVLPFGRGGIIGGSMLGLGRALGETIAVALIISPIFYISIHWLHTGANGVAPLIALRFGEASQKYGIPALMAAGLTLFLATLVVNFLASMIVARSRSGVGVEI